MLRRIKNTKTEGRRYTIREAAKLMPDIEEERFVVFLWQVLKWSDKPACEGMHCSMWIAPDAEDVMHADRTNAYLFSAGMRAAEHALKEHRKARRAGATVEDAAQIARDAASAVRDYERGFGVPFGETGKPPKFEYEGDDESGDEDEDLPWNF